MVLPVIDPNGIKNDDGFEISVGYVIRGEKMEELAEVWAKLLFSYCPATFTDRLMKEYQKLLNG